MVDRHAAQVKGKRYARGSSNSICIIIWLYHSVYRRTGDWLIRFQDQIFYLTHFAAHVTSPLQEQNGEDDLKHFLNLHGYAISTQDRMKEGIMVKRVLTTALCALMVAASSLAFAGGAVYGPAPCPPAAGPAGGNPCAYWGDAPFPGMCGGVVALPFLVVGSLLGGNTVGPYGPVPAPGYAAAPPAPGYAAAPPPYPPAKPIYAPGYGPAPYNASVVGNGPLGGLPCFDMLSGLFGSLAYGTGLGL